MNPYYANRTTLPLPSGERVGVRECRGEEEKRMQGALA
jgi:hypothetical protein